MTFLVQGMRPVEVMSLLSDKKPGMEPGFKLEELTVCCAASRLFFHELPYDRK